MILLPKCILWLPRPGIQSLWPHEDFAEPGTRPRETHGVCACGVRANNGDEIRQTDAPDAIIPNRVHKPVTSAKAVI